MKRKEREEARRLRRDGRSIKSIAAEIGVSSSSVLSWTTDIELSAEQRKHLMGRTGAFAGAVVRRDRALAVRVQSQQRGQLECGAFNLHLAGCMLYWAEGAKTRNRLHFSNSDPDMIRLFVRFLRECFGVSDDRLCLVIRCYTNNVLPIKEIEEYWLNITGLVRSNLRKTQVNKISRASKRVAKPLLYGTCHIKLYDTDIAQRVRGATQKYAGFSREDWLW